MIDYAKSLRYIIIYGDTDSIFFIIPIKEFIYLFNKYYIKRKILPLILSKIKQLFLYEMIKKTFELSKDLEHKVNEFLKQHIDSSYMKMAYEKTVMLSRFFQKKQYCGIVHENNVEFDSPILFKKGLKVVKRNASKFYKLVAKEMLWMVLGFDENLLLINENINSMQVVRRIIKKYLKKNFENDLDVF